MITMVQTTAIMQGLNKQAALRARVPDHLKRARANDLKRARANDA